MFELITSHSAGVDPMLGANEHSLEGISPLQAYLCAKASRHIYSDTKHIATELYRKPPIDEARKVRYTWREYNGVELSMDAVEPMQKEPHQSIYEQDRADRDFSPSMKSIADEHMYIIHNRHPRCIFYMSNGSNHTLVDDKAYLVFRGTHEGNDVGVILDHELAQFKTDKATLMAHRGIAGKLDQIWGRIEAELKQLPKSIKQLYITGHSLGGAYALLCGARILMSKQHLLPPGVSVKVVTFGAPLVFARNALEDKALPTALTAAMKGRTFNFVFGCDVVPRLLGTGLSTTFIKMLQVAGIGCPGNAEANTGTSTADGVSESSSFSLYVCSVHWLGVVRNESTTLQVKAQH
ncbi:hypothetical protein SARC_05012 [Sphaeroforma arctica JP610]|uniref:Fungal lipase-type domain-containing protein n=1 Tax=Sphaeroforma arctica JP610 TaxID=667725 RepID=A0A0L0G1L7_9EUKA|nr:hypothetical protein SARC_05012 [Sphaeroforma arctica JP610]KNC82711.1 hypothetical protein SARC_05012 [Sphaeroforma arctica JP610]|eukprot:XP_014156613.1 hypothetical protein SARC_05012 [Sphaeroforma arctica JP610]